MGHTKRRVFFINAFVVLAVLAGIFTISGASVHASDGFAVTTVSPSNGTVVSGNLPWTVTTNEDTQKVEFFIDGVYRWREWMTPYTFKGDGHTLDTTTVANGTHVLSVVAYRQNSDKTATAQVTVDVENGGSAPSAPPAAPTSSTTTSTPSPTPTTTSAPSPTPTATVASTARAGAELSVTTDAPADGQTVAGRITWSVVVSGGKVNRVDFSVDGTVSGSDRKEPYTFGGSGGTLDTTTLADGTHRLTATAYGVGGSTASSSVSVAVANHRVATLSPPGSVTAPAVSGTPSTGLVMSATAGTWTNSPTAYEYAWQRCGAAGGSCVAISGATGSTYTTASADAGSTLRIAVTASNAAGSGLAVSASSAVIQSPNRGSESGPTWPDTTSPAFVPNRVAATPSDFSSIMGSLHAGDVVEVKPMTLSGEIVFGQKLSSPAQIHFDSGVYFTGSSAGTNNPAVWIHGSNLSLYGGDVSGMGNDCVKVSAGSADTSGPTNIRWWGLKVHACGGSGFAAQGNKYPNTNLDIQLEAWKWGQNLAIDPHAVKGTGFHGAYIGGGNAPTSGRFIVYAHDNQYGAGVEAGSNLQNADLWERAANLTWSGTVGMAGNAFQPWGSNNKNVVVHDLEVSNITGYALLDESLTGGSGNVVQYARSSGVNASPIYQPSPFVVCQDCK
jgi:hypothetical protein